MNYLVVSCTTYDGGGLAMIRGAINGISQLDHHAHFACLHKPEHESKKAGLAWYKEPEQNEEAFQWADCILDIGGLCTNQGNKYTWKSLRDKYKKPYVWMAQSFIGPDPILLEGTTVIARGQRAAEAVRKAGANVRIGADLSFLVRPHYVNLKPRRVFVTHIGKDWGPMKNMVDPKLDIQVITKNENSGFQWEPHIEELQSMYCSPEIAFGIVQNCEEVHTARYQMACAGILAGKPVTIYGKGNDRYDAKYADLFDLNGMKPEHIQELAMVSCRAAWGAVNGTD